MKTLLLIAMMVGSTLTHAKLINKVAGIINDEVYTLGQLQRTQKTIEARRKIAPSLYTKEVNTLKELLELEQEVFIIRNKLSEIGIQVTDDTVEGQIQKIEKDKNLRRSDLLDFLESVGLSFNEYFELTRQNIEFSIFNSRIMAPLISITDQELKNLFYKRSDKKNTFSFIFTVIDFAIPLSKEVSDNLDHITKDLLTYRRTGTLPSYLKDLQSNDLGVLSGEDLPKDLRETLRGTVESEFSEVYVKDGVAHNFFVRKKELKESQAFLSQKDMLYNELYIKKSKTIKQSWFNKEKINFYIYSTL